MENKLELLLVEDDEADVRAMQNEIDDNIDDFSLIATTSNATKAVEYILETQPDVVLLDLELTNGSGNGIDVLRKIKDERMERPPYFLVLTNNISTITHQAVRGYGADYIMTKTQNGYSPKTVLDFLRTLKPAIKSRKTNDVDLDKRTPTQRARALANAVDKEFERIGINPKHKGYQYLKDSVIMLVTQETDESFAKILAPKYNKSTASIERAMENAIRWTWTHSSTETLYQYFTVPIRSKTGSPSLTEFICFYARKLQNIY